MLRRLGLGLVACWFAACTLVARRPERLPDGTYRTSCSTPLTQCLESFETICESHGYDVISASEDRKRPDLREIPDVIVTSEAHVRCRTPEPIFGWWGGKPAPSQGRAAPAPAQPSSQVDPKVQLCREGSSRDRAGECRELGTLSNSDFAVSGSGLATDAPAARGGARAAIQRSSVAVTAPAPFEDWPAGSSPQEVGARVARNYLARPLALGTPMHYAEACTWYGALTTAKLLGDAALEASLVARFAPILTPAGAAVIPPRAHVDDRVFGIVPLEIAIHAGPGKSLDYLPLGKGLADKQWATTTPDGLTAEARYWVDDMYMITALQVQAFRATGNARYLDRAAQAMAAYLDKLQQPNGLFFHTATSPRPWGRGNGWFAAGMAELLRALPPTDPRHARILAGYQKMMAALLRTQTASGMWRQLVDDDSAANWPETSSTGMFAFAMVTGVKNGWLPADPYGAAARKAWLALVQHLDADGNVHDVCVGTGEAATSGGGTSAAAQIRYYLDRPRSAGDFHGQAPLLWTASALMR
jgi:unsaturated rhamnogalacturonyl hydrolase